MRLFPGSFRLRPLGWGSPTWYRSQVSGSFLEFLFGDSGGWWPLSMGQMVHSWFSSLPQHNEFVPTGLQMLSGFLLKEMEVQSGLIIFPWSLAHSILAGQYRGYLAFFLCCFLRALLPSLLWTLFLVPQPTYQWPSHYPLTLPSPPGMPDCSRPVGIGWLRGCLAVHWNRTNTPHKPVIFRLQRTNIWSPQDTEAHLQSPAVWPR